MKSWVLLFEDVYMNLQITHECNGLLECHLLSSFTLAPRRSEVRTCELGDLNPCILHNFAVPFPYSAICVTKLSSTSRQRLFSFSIINGSASLLEYHSYQLWFIIMEPESGDLPEVQKLRSVFNPPHAPLISIPHVKQHLSLGLLPREDGEC